MPNLQLASDTDVDMTAQDSIPSEKQLGKAFLKFCDLDHIMADTWYYNVRGICALPHG